jgi:hypothetical protein
MFTDKSRMIRSMGKVLSVRIRVHLWRIVFSNRMDDFQT